MKKATNSKNTIRETLKAEERRIFGRKVKRLRAQGWLPASVYGRKIKSQSIQVKKDDLESIYKKVGETGLLKLLLGKEEKPVLIHNLQKDPVSDELLHVDFLQVDLKEKVTTTVPVEFVGESPAEKSGIGTVVQETKEVEVEALPVDLPERFIVDISTLSEVDQLIKVGDLKYDKEKIEIKTPKERIIVKVEPPQKEEVVSPPPQEEVVKEAPPEAKEQSGEEGPKEEKSQS